MSAIDTILRTLEQWPLWKRMTQAPARLDELEKRVAALEARAKGGAVDACPLCGGEMKVVSVMPHPTFGTFGIQQHSLACQSCTHSEKRKVDPNKS
ncbi:hypothetical protein [Parvibaculum sp.]|uniref:hypothetical protein n=1 Tax=Parvibaculum sp. TaxID=2024848 RepID=UPI002734110F|nr:hypothetical protein [Parvibaculum sp.]MDP3327719.1 hypothetical protein [Parvibaculum sp.]